MIPNELKEMINELTAVALEYDAVTDIDFVDGNVKISVKPRSYKIVEANINRLTNKMADIPN